MYTVQITCTLYKLHVHCTNYMYTVQIKFTLYSPLKIKILLGRFPSFDFCLNVRQTLNDGNSLARHGWILVLWLGTLQFTKSRVNTTFTLKRSPDWETLTSNGLEPQIHYWSLLSSLPHVIWFDLIWKSKQLNY